MADKPEKKKRQKTQAGCLCARANLLLKSRSARRIWSVPRNKISNRIRITPQTDLTKCSVDAALSFPLKNIVEAMKANADIPGGTLSINSAGIAQLKFKSKEFSCIYYQFASKK